MSHILGGNARNRLVVLALLVLVFVAGALTALAAVRIADRRAEAAAPAWTDAGSPPGSVPAAPARGRGGDRMDRMNRMRMRNGPMGPSAMSHVLADRLGLSEEQRAKVAEVLERRRQQSDSILAEIRPRLAANLDSAHAEIRELLDAGQREAFDRFLAEGRSQMFRRLGRPFPPGQEGARR